MRGTMFAGAALAVLALATTAQGEMDWLAEEYSPFKAA